MDPALASSKSWSVAIRSMRGPQWARFLVLPAASLGSHVVRAPGGALHAAASLVLGTLTAALLLAYAYGLNAIADRATDRDPRKNPLAGVSICPPAVRVSVGAAAFGALALAMVGGPRPVFACVLSLAASTAYSVGPRIKALPIAGTLLNAVIFAPLMLLAPGGERPSALAALLTLFIALILQNQLLHERADRQEDADAGVMTTARWLGDRTTLVAVAMLGVAGAFAVLTFAPTGMTCATATSGLCLATTVGLVIADPPGRRRVAHRWASIAAGAALFAVGFFA